MKSRFAGLCGLFRWLALPCLAGLLGACAAAPQESPCEKGETDDVPWESLAPGLWVWRGAVAEISATNRGHVAPTSVFIDSGEAAVIDPGPSFRHAWRVRRSVECRFNARARWVVNSHAHAENVLGNAAFSDLLAAPGFDIVSTPATLAAMKERCPACLASLTAKVGATEMAGTHIVLPTRSVAPGELLAVGRQHLQVMAIEQGHTEGDLVLWSPAVRTLWAGGLVYQGRVPELAQGSLEGWLAALDHLERLAPQRLVSAVVSEDPSKAMGATRAYLEALRAGVLQAMDQGRQPQESALVSLPAFAHWAGYAERHAFNVQRAWRELEPVWMDQGR